MAPASGKTSYKTYEAQARLVRAMVAAHPGMKWDYKEIAKYFGQSTGDGIQFQFRSIKKDAEKLRQVESTGGDVASALASELQGGAVTPSAVTPSKSTSRRRAPASGSTRKRTVQQEVDLIKQEGSDEDFEEALTGDHGEQTPSKRPKVDSDRMPLPQNRNKSASGSFAVRSSATPSRSGRAPEAIRESSQSPIDLETPMSSAPTSLASIFGPVTPKVNKSNGGSNDGVSSAFKSNGFDAYVGSQDPSTSMYTNASFSFNDGEI